MQIQRITKIDAEECKKMIIDRKLLKLVKGKIYLGEWLRQEAIRAE